MPSPVSSTLTRTSRRARTSTSTATEPSAGVWRRAFVSRLSSTRSRWSGAQRTGGQRLGQRATRGGRRGPRRLGLHAAQAALDQPAELRLAQLEGQRAGVDARELEQVVDEAAEAPRPGRASRAGSARAGQPVLDRLQHRLQGRRAACAGRGSRGPPAGGGRRRARSSSPAITLNAAPSCGHLGRPVLGRPGARSPRASASLAARTPLDAGARPSAPPGARRRAPRRRRRGDGEHRQVVAQSNISTPESTTAPRGRTTATRARADERRRSVGSRRSTSAAATPTARVAARPRRGRAPITARTGSRRPTPSAGARGGTGRPRSSRAAGGRGR